MEDKGLGETIVQDPNESSETLGDENENQLKDSMAKAHRPRRRARKSDDVLDYPETSEGSADSAKQRRAKRNARNKSRKDTIVVVEETESSPSKSVEQSTSPKSESRNNLTLTINTTLKSSTQGPVSPSFASADNTPLKTLRHSTDMPLPTVKKPSSSTVESTPPQVFGRREIF